MLVWLGLYRVKPYMAARRWREIALRLVPGRHLTPSSVT